MTNFERIAASPEALGGFLAQELDMDGPWDDAFHAEYCVKCWSENCDECPNGVQRHNPLWWLGLEAAPGWESSRVSDGMSHAEIRATLEKQLLLLSERSKFARDYLPGEAELPQLTEAMLDVAIALNAVRRT